MFPLRNILVIFLKTEKKQLFHHKNIVISLETFYLLVFLSYSNFLMLSLKYIFKFVKKLNKTLV